MSVEWSSSGRLVHTFSRGFLERTPEELVTGIELLRCGDLYFPSAPPTPTGGEVCCHCPRTFVGVEDSFELPEEMDKDDFEVLPPTDVPLSLSPRRAGDEHLGTEE